MIPRNQPKICIVSDLKDEYHPAIEKVGVRHQFCMFHTKQKINRNIREDKKEIIILMKNWNT